MTQVIPSPDKHPTQIVRETECELILPIPFESYENQHVSH
jgi:hypothetical protein